MFSPRLEFQIDEHDRCKDTTRSADPSSQDALIRQRILQNLRHVNVRCVVRERTES